VAMAETVPRWTLSDLDRLPDDGNTYEVIRGALFVTPAPSYAHESIAAALRSRIEPYVLRHRIGRVFVPRAVVQVAGSQAEPDLMVRPPTAARPKDWAAAPTPLLVVEILSATTRGRDEKDKREFYADAGIPEYWIADGDARAVTIIRPDTADAQVQDTLAWHPNALVPPLLIDLPELFREALD